MEKVSREVHPGQGSDLICARDAFQLPVQPPLHFPTPPRAGQSREEAILRSLARRAARAVRPLVQGAQRHERWVMAFDNDCEQAGLLRLVAGEQDAPCAFVAPVLGWAVAAKARAIVLVQNRPGRRRLSAPVDLVPTLKLAAAVNLFGILLVDHVLIPNGGHATVSLWNRRVLPEATALTAQFGTALEALAAEHRSFGVSAEVAEAR